jgi:mRNA interferase MazF
MAGLVKGDVDVVPFPFSDLTVAKRRPALVVAELEGDDPILCQITSRPLADRYSVPLDERDFMDGGLHLPSNVRPNRLFTADNHIILYRVGGEAQHKLAEVTDRIVTILRG